MGRHSNTRFWFLAGGIIQSSRSISLVSRELEAVMFCIRAKTSGVTFARLSFRATEKLPRGARKCVQHLKPRTGARKVVKKFFCICSSFAFVVFIKVVFLALFLEGRFWYQSGPPPKGGVVTNPLRVQGRTESSLFLELQSTI